MIYDVITHTYIHSFHETQFTYLHGQYIYRVYINVYTHKYLKLYIFTRIKNINMHVFETVGLSDTLIAITEQHDKKIVNIYTHAYTLVPLLINKYPT